MRVHGGEAQKCDDHSRTNQRNSSCVGLTMADWAYPDGNIHHLIQSRSLDARQVVNRPLQMHSSLVQRLALECELEGHEGCVNSIAWNSKGSLLISGSDDTTVNIWDYASRSLVHSIDSGHSTNIFCTKFIPETSDELVASGAGDAEVRVFNICREHLRKEYFLEPLALFHCHTKRVKKLAVEIGNPNVIWSASEDGTLRQHDLREGSSCPPAGSSHQECRNILLDLRAGSKKFLSDPPKNCLALKSCDISSTRPHQLLVGGTDAFARLYDRRMLPPLSSAEKRMSPPTSVELFCPMHLSERTRSNIHLTHVAFSPNGEELLLSYSGEHVYLMDVNSVNTSTTRYTVDDIAKHMRVEIAPFGTEMSSNKPPLTSTNFPTKIHNKIEELLRVAEKTFEESDFFHGIEVCNELLDGRINELGNGQKYDCFCIRAAFYLKRKWKNDSHMAIRDCNKARSINPASYTAYFYLAEALFQLEKYKAALEFALAAQSLAPSNTEVMTKVEVIKQQLAAAEAEKNGNDGTSRAESWRRRSLSDAIFRSDITNDATQDSPRLEREDSDYDEEMEVDFETSVSDEALEIESGILRGSLNLRFHRARDRQTNDSSSSLQNENSVYQPEAVFDMKQRYVGHCNLGTDIKQASFLGQNARYVASGSDDGRWFIWEKKTGRLVKMLAGDVTVVNGIQCHPFDCAIATSGIDHTIKMWTPHAEVPSIVAGGPAGPESPDFRSVILANQRKLSRNRESFPFELLEQIRLHEFAEGTFHPLECAQS